MAWPRKNKDLWEYLIIALGVTLLAVSITVFYEPSGLVTGGVSGIAIIVERKAPLWFGLDIPIWLTNTILNIPLFVMGTKLLGFKFLRKTLFATAFLSFALWLTAYIPPIKMDFLLAAVFGGVFSGAGLGLVFRCMATTGGSDLLASIVHKYNRHISMSKLMFVIDGIVILAGLFIFSPEQTMYAILAVFVSAKLIDAVLEGLSFSKAVFIISEQADAIAARILTEMNRGVTGLNGTGMYTKQEKNVLLCVVSAKEIAQIKDITGAVDARAFVIVADVKEVLGEGFQSI